MRKTIIVFAALICLFTTVNAQKKATEVSITSSGIKRTMLVHVPTKIADNAPLVISLHGFNQSAQYQMDNTNWNNVADENGFIVVYPQYDGGFWDVSGDKDVTFMKNIISYMYRNYKINKNRVYATGFSLGAMMTYHLITKSAGTFAAYGPVSGVCFDNRKISASRHVPLIHHHGSADDVFKFGGDPYHASGGYPAITEYVKSWAQFNGCDVSKPKVTKIGGDTKTEYVNQEEGIKTVINVINGAGHWHSDSTWGGINTTNEIWNFCKRYSLDNDLSFALVRINPSESSTSVTAETTFNLAFNEYVAAKSSVATVEGNGQVIELENISTSDKSKLAKFKFPEGTEFAGGEYKMHIKDLKLVEDGRIGQMTFTYNIEATASAINATSADITPKQAYTLSGTKANESTKGIIVSEGKKVLKK